MHDLDQRFHDILDKSGVDFYVEEGFGLLKERYPNLDIYADIKAIWDSIPDDARVAIYGAGSHTKKLLEVIDASKKNVVCVVDKLVPNGTFLGYPLIKQHEITDYNVDTVFLSSLGFKDEIKNEICDAIGNGVIIDMYDELGKRGYEFTEPFYSQKNYETYLRLYAIKQLFIETADSRLLSTLIYSYLEMHDFAGAFRYIDIYVDGGYRDGARMRALKESIKQMFADIKDELNASKCNNVLVVLFDALRYRDVVPDHMPYLSTLSENHGLMLTRAYCHAPYTHMSLASIFKQEKLLDDKLYLTSDVDDVDFFASLDKQGGSFRYYGPETQFFNRKHLGPPSNETAPDYFWSYLKGRLLQGEDMLDLSFLHCEETHAPFMCGEHSVYPKLYDVYCREITEDPQHQFAQYVDTLRYLDGQLAFWLPLVLDTTNVLMFSDHGYIFDYDLDARRKHYFIEDTAHIPYFIFQKDRTPGVTNRMVSHLDTLDIMTNLSKGDDPFAGLPTRDVVEIDRDFTYSLRDLGLMSDIGCTYLGAAFKCWVFEDGMKYIRYYNGEEELYCLPDEQTDLIKEDRYAVCLEDIRSRVNLSFPDWSEDRWGYAREAFNVEPGN